MFNKANMCSESDDIVLAGTWWKVCNIMFVNRVYSAGNQHHLEDTYVPLDGVLGCVLHRSLFAAGLSFQTFFQTSTYIPVKVRLWVLMRD